MNRRRRLTRWRGAAAPLFIAAFASCAYFNGVYNAKEEQRRADSRMNSGRTDEARVSYALSAAKAETVLARYPRTRWRDDALYFAGRGAALSDQCRLAAPRLHELLARSDVDGERRERASLALAACEVRTSRLDSARLRLAPLLASRRPDVASDAAMWAARAAIAVGDVSAATVYLQRVDAAVAHWELMSAALAAMQYARAESLLVLRAERGDFREAVLPALAALWADGRRPGVARIVRAFERARTPAAGKVVIELAAADLAIASGADSIARVHLVSARRNAADPSTEAEITARLELLDLADVTTIGDASAVIGRAAQRARMSLVHRRLDENLLFTRLLAERRDFSGASLFLAGEVARDSLRAPRLAHALFAQVASTMVNAPVAPKALLAAAVLLPDSADAYHERVRTVYARSPYAVVFARSDSGELPTLRRSEEQLRQVWLTVSGILADSLRLRRGEGAARAATDTARDTPAGAAPPPGSAPPR